MPIQDAMNVLLSWLPYTSRKSLDSRAEDTCPTLSPLLQHPRLRDLAENTDVKPVLGAARMLSKDSILPDDHLVWSDVEFVHAVKLMSSPFAEHCSAAVPQAQQPEERRPVAEVLLCIVYVHSRKSVVYWHNRYVSTCQHAALLSQSRAQRTLC